MDALRALAARLDEASATLTTLSRTVTVSDPPQPRSARTPPGRPGEVGRALHRQWTTATDDRAREARAAAGRLAAAAVGACAAPPTATARSTDAARRRLTGEA